MKQQWEVIIGLEIHVQLLTRTKIFSGASTTFGSEPNSQACAIDLGFPGVLPVVNAEVFPKAIAFGLGVGGRINLVSAFDRKNYFYPDLPKGYQITQMDKPIVLDGAVEIPLEDGSMKTINITRAHLEEDAGKSLHEDFRDKTGIDLNRAGIPLLEIVSEPDMRSADEAISYARYIHQLVTYLGVSDGEMSQGSLRCDANVSVRPYGSDVLGTRTETKNVNSFRFLDRAIRYEIARQTEILESGGRIIQETRLYDPDRDETRPMRSKETAMDYRYFPEPDLLPIEIDQAYIENIRRQMPELPREKANRLHNDFQLSLDDARVLASNPTLADYFETVSRQCGDAKLASNWIRVELLGRMHRDNLEISNIPVSSSQLGTLLTRIRDNTINGKTAKDLLDALWYGKTTSVDDFIEANNLKQVSDDSELGSLIDRIIAENPKQVEQYRAGRSRLLGFFVGQVMKETGGKANPALANELLQKKLG